METIWILSINQVKIQPKEKHHPPQQYRMERNPKRYVNSMFWYFTVQRQKIYFHNISIYKYKFKVFQFIKSVLYKMEDISFLYFELYKKNYNADYENQWQSRVTRDNYSDDICFHLLSGEIFTCYWSSIHLSWVSRNYQYHIIDIRFCAIDKI